jgi:hypothetical protein
MRSRNGRNSTTRWRRCAAGKNGAVRSVFEAASPSSTMARARSGGSGYNVTMSGTLGIRNGASESVKVSVQCGCRPNARHTRLTVAWRIPCAWPSRGCSVRTIRPRSQRREFVAVFPAAVRQTGPRLDWRRSAATCGMVAGDMRNRRGTTPLSRPSASVQISRACLPGRVSNISTVDRGRPSIRSVRPASRSMAPMSTQRDPAPGDPERRFVTSGQRLRDRVEAAQETAVVV